VNKPRLPAAQPGGRRRVLCSAIFAAPCVLLTAIGCQESLPPPERPLSPDERRQFDEPLQFSAWQEPGGWPQFGHDPLHSGRSDVDLQSPHLEAAWQFRPTDHVWPYQPEYCAWSSPVAGTVTGRPLIIAGYYDRNVYAIDARTGQKAWEFRPGACVFASPALGEAGGRAMVFVASVNRSIYGLDAVTGNKCWEFPTASWSFTQAASFMSSPTLVRDGEVEILLLGAWNADRSSSRNIQDGEVLALRAARGTLLWRKRLGSARVTSPVVAKLGGEFTVFVATHTGMIHALRLQDGREIWQAVLNEELRSSPSVVNVEGLARLFVGTRFHTLLGLDCQWGARRVRAQAGYWIDATPSWFRTHNGTTAVVAGSHDQRIHAWSAASGLHLWSAKTGNYAYSSTALARLAGRPVTLTMSWDEHVYLLDGETGDGIWKAKSGPLLWSHVFQGDSLWASPIVAKMAERPMILVPACDGVLYAFQPRGSAPSKSSYQTPATGEHPDP